jgi:hypothetical protein
VNGQQGNGYNQYPYGMYGHQGYGNESALPFLYAASLFSAGAYGGGFGAYGGNSPVVSSVAGTSNAGWVPTSPSWYNTYRADIAYTAMLNTVGNPPGPGISPMGTSSQVSGKGSVLLHYPAGAQLSVNGTNEKETTGEHQLSRPSSIRARRTRSTSSSPGTMRTASIASWRRTSPCPPAIRRAS